MKRPQPDSQWLSELRTSSSTHPQKLDTFYVATKVHLVAAEIYLLLSRRLARDPDLRALFGLLAFEEAARAGRIHRALTHCRQRSIPLPEIPEMPMRLLFARMRARQRSLKRTAAPSADKALELAYAIDSELYGIRADKLFRYLDPVLDDHLAVRASGDAGQRALHSRPREPRQRAKTRPFGIGPFALGLPRISRSRLAPAFALG